MEIRWNDVIISDDNVLTQDPSDFLLCYDTQETQGLLSAKILFPESHVS